MTSSPRSFGHETEQEAARFLKGCGYRIIERNVRFRRGEIDLVAYDGDVLVFVEVKGRRTENYGGARWAVDERKKRRLDRLAGEYLSRRNLPLPPCRFDLVLVQLDPGGLRCCRLIQNAFDSTGVYPGA